MVILVQSTSIFICGRFHWKFHTINLHKDASGEATKSYHNPFLVDNNFEDLVYSENLVAHVPMRASYMGKGAAMQTFYDAAKSASYGGVAPLQSQRLRIHCDYALILQRMTLFAPDVEQILMYYRPTCFP